MNWWSWLLVALAVSLVVYALFVGLLVVAGRRDDARALVTLIPDCIVLVGRLVRDPRVPRRRKALLFALAGYLDVAVRSRAGLHSRSPGSSTTRSSSALVLRSLLRGGGEPLVRELWPGPERTLDLILRLAR